MRLRRLVGGLLVCALAWGGACRAAAATPTTVALTLIGSGGADDGQPLGEKLLSLLKQAIQGDASLALVEHHEIDRVLARQLLGRSNAAGLEQQLGKVLPADCLVMLETLPPGKDSATPWGRLRVIDVKTGAIRGITASGLDRETLDQTAGEFARYVSALVGAPDQPSVTVSVMPFDSKGQFDRLRPLELRLRDLITARLIELSGAVTAGEQAGGEAQGAKTAEPPRFQVLQRSNLAELTHERELIRAGYSSGGNPPESAAAPAVSYLIRGEVDERQESDFRTLTVRGEMIDTQTNRPVEEFRFECAAADLEQQLVARVGKIAERLRQGAKSARATEAKGDAEGDSLRKAALADLERMMRNNPSNQQPRFMLPGHTRSFGGPDAVGGNTPLGQSILRKSIERLEAVLAANPDDAEAAYALGFCYSFHQPEIYRSDRADELLRTVYRLDPQSEFAALALVYLAWIAYDDQTGRLAPGSESEALERLRFAFEHMPEKYRSHLGWIDLLVRAGKLLRRPEQAEELAYLVNLAVGFLDNGAKGVPHGLARQIAPLAEQLAFQDRKQPAFRAQAEKLLRGWAGSEDLVLVDAGSESLARMLVGEHQFAEAASVLERAAGRFSSAESVADHETQGKLLLHAAGYYRNARNPEKALALLDAPELRTLADSHASGANWIAGNRQYEIGCCRQDLKQPKEALAAFLQAAEALPSAGLVNHINGLGGIPLRPDRDVDVRYLPASGGKKGAGERLLPPACLATDGRLIYLGTTTGLQAYGVATRKWKPALKSTAITCLKYAAGQLWAGTASEGLWRLDVKSGKWTEIAAGKLPDKHVASLALIGDEAYVGVGVPPSGGLVLVDRYQRVTTLSGPRAPGMAPTHLVATEEALLARTDKAIHTYDLKSKEWSVSEPRYGAPRLFAGQDSVWASTPTKELVPWPATPGDDQRFKPAWYVRKTGDSHGGLPIDFISEHHGQIWFGGEPAALITSSGLYRFDPQTGQFYAFAPADGFKTVLLHRVYDGLWLDDQLWLATEAGLCRVTPRGAGAETKAPAKGRMRHADSPRAEKESPER